MKKKLLFMPAESLHLSTKGHLVIVTSDPFHEIYNGLILSYSVTTKVMDKADIATEAQLPKGTEIVLVEDTIQEEDSEVTLTRLYNFIQHCPPGTVSVGRISKDQQGVALVKRLQRNRIVTGESAKKTMTIKAYLSSIMKPGLGNSEYDTASQIQGVCDKVSAAGYTETRPEVIRMMYELARAGPYVDPPPVFVGKNGLRGKDGDKSPPPAVQKKQPRELAVVEEVLGGSVLTDNPEAELAVGGIEKKLGVKDENTQPNELPEIVIDPADTRIFQVFKRNKDLVALYSSEDAFIDAVVDVLPHRIRCPERYIARTILHNATGVNLTQPRGSTSTKARREKAQTASAALAVTVPDEEIQETEVTQEMITPIGRSELTIPEGATSYAQVVRANESLIKERGKTSFARAALEFLPKAIRPSNEGSAIACIASALKSKGGERVAREKKVTRRVAGKAPAKKSAAKATASETDLSAKSAPQPQPNSANDDSAVKTGDVQTSSVSTAGTDHEKTGTNGHQPGTELSLSAQSLVPDAAQSQNGHNSTSLHLLEKDGSYDFNNLLAELPSEERFLFEQSVIAAVNNRRRLLVYGEFMHQVVTAGKLAQSIVGE
jgi:hypothetical protein